MPLTHIHVQITRRKRKRTRKPVAPATGPVPATTPAASVLPVPPAASITEDALPSENVAAPTSLDSAKQLIGSLPSRPQPVAAEPDPMEELLEQAINLLDSMSQQPALRDFSALKQRLDDIEQRLGYGAYPQ